ncbi:MAG: PilZ domain-containing protein [Krumholzibacteria bacterium]|nr:PilZ domain-containing protein [Candidatus Krumholzibacteria bacterium]
MDRRHRDRTPLFVPCLVHCAVTGRLLGHAVDLSPRGLRVVCARPLELFLDYPLVLRMDDGRTEVRELALEARCVWTMREQKPRVDSAGFEFRQVNPHLEALLEEFGGRCRTRRQVS